MCIAAYGSWGISFSLCKPYWLKAVMFTYKEPQRISKPPCRPYSCKNARIPSSLGKCWCQIPRGLKLLFCVDHIWSQQSWVLLATDQEFGPLSTDCHFLVRGYITREGFSDGSFLFECRWVRFFFLEVLEKGLAWWWLYQIKSWIINLTQLEFDNWSLLVVFLFVFVLFCFLGSAKGGSNIIIISYSLLPWCFVSGLS